MNPEIGSRGSTGIALARGPLATNRGSRVESTRFTLPRSPLKLHSVAVRNFDARPSTPRTFRHQTRPRFRPELTRARLDSPRLSPHRRARNRFASLESAIARAGKFREVREVARKVRIEARRGRARWRIQPSGTIESAARVSSLIGHKAESPGAKRAETKISRPVPSIEQQAQKPKIITEKPKNSQAAILKDQIKEDISTTVNKVEKVEIKAIKAPVIKQKDRVVRAIQAYLNKPQADRLTQVLAAPQAKVLEKVGVRAKNLNQLKSPTLREFDEIVLQAIRSSLQTLEQQNYSDKQIVDGAKISAKTGPKVAGQPAESLNLRIANQVDAMAALLINETDHQVRQTYTALKAIGKDGKAEAGDLIGEALKTRVENLGVQDQIGLIKQLEARGQLADLDPESKIRVHIIAHKEVTEEELQAEVYNPAMQARQQSLAATAQRLRARKTRASGAELIAEMGPETPAERSPISPDGVTDGSWDNGKMEAAEQEEMEIEALHNRTWQIFLDHPAVRYVKRVETKRATDEQVYEVLNQAISDVREKAKQRAYAILAALVPT